MAHEVVEGSIKVVRIKPVRIGNKTYNYEVFWSGYPYGVKSKMIQRASQLATDRKDADAWVKVLRKDVVKLRGMM